MKHPLPASEQFARYTCDICGRSRIGSKMPESWHAWFYELDLMMAHACDECTEEDTLEEIEVPNG